MEDKSTAFEYLLFDAVLPIRTFDNPTLWQPTLRTNPSPVLCTRRSQRLQEIPTVSKSIQDYAIQQMYLLGEKTELSFSREALNAACLCTVATFSNHLHTCCIRESAFKPCDESTKQLGSSTTV